MVATRLACASSLCISRYCRSRRVLSKAMVAFAAQFPTKQNFFLGQVFSRFAGQTNYPDYLIVFEQRHKQARSNTCAYYLNRKIISMVALKCCEVGDVGG